MRRGVYYRGTLNKMAVSPFWLKGPFFFFFFLCYSLPHFVAFLALPAWQTNHSTLYKPLSCTRPNSSVQPAVNILLKTAPHVPSSPTTKSSQHNPSHRLATTTSTPATTSSTSSNPRTFPLRHSLPNHHVLFPHSFSLTGASPHSHWSAARPTNRPPTPRLHHLPTASIPYSLKTS